MDDIYENIEECNPNKKCKILMVLYDMVADMLNDKNLNGNWINYLPEVKN